jgi:hexokinase
MSGSSTSRSHKPTHASTPTQISGSDRRKLEQSPLATHTVVIGLVLLLALLTHFFSPHLHAIWRLVSKDQAPGITLRNPIVLHAPPVCPKPQQEIEFVGTFNRKPARSMALADQAKRVAAEFDFSDDAVSKAVKEFIREMGMW